MPLYDTEFQLSVSDEGRCRYIGEDLLQSCAHASKLGSSYCAPHHTLCHISVGTYAELARLAEIDALAAAVGGKLPRRGGAPSPRFLAQLKMLADVPTRLHRTLIKRVVR